VTIGTEPRASRAQLPRHRKPGIEPRRRWLWPAGIMLTGLGLFVAYLRQAKTTPLRSDGASNILQAWDMLHGNVLLRGWTLSDVSFYTTELPQYVVVEMLRGFGASVVCWAAAMTYTLLVLGSAVLARGSASGLEGAVRALVAGGIMLAPSATGGTITLLANPDHTGTQVVLLAAWLVIDRWRGRPWGPVVVAVLLAWGQIADPIVLYEGVLPLALVCGLRLYLRRGERPCFRREERCDLLLAVAALLSAGAAWLAMAVISHVGGFVVTRPSEVFTHVDTLSSHLAVTAESILILYGADFSRKQLGSGAITLVHLAGVALAGWAVTRAARRFGNCEFLVQVLVVAMLVVVVAYTVTGTMIPASNHEMVGVLPIGAVLAGRVLTRPLLNRQTRTPLAALGIVLACYAGALAHHADAAPAADPNRQLAAWLDKHDLHDGFASYWTASAVTVDSRNTVRVRPVSQTGRTLSVVPWESKASWYTPAGDPRFVIISRHDNTCWRVTVGWWWNSASRTFGPPVSAHHVADYLILVWDRNMLSGHHRLRTLPPTSPAMC
jgi:hypothetical protein